MNAEDAKQYLIGKGKKPTLDEDGRQEFHWAIDDGDLEEIKAWLAIGMSVDTEQDESFPIIRTAEQNKPELARFFIEQGADLDVRDRDGDTALHTAVNWSNEEVFNLLVELGSPINTSNRWTDTPLTSAVESHEEFIQPLLDAGADPNYGLKHGRCPLFMALEEYNTDAASTLVAGGADPNLEMGKQTLLTFAVRTEEEHIVEFLIENGADINKPNAWGWTPMMIAYQQNALEDILGDAGANTDGVELADLFGLIEEGLVEDAKPLLEKYGIDIRDSTGRTPLLYADDAETLKALIDLGADTSARDEDGGDAFERAAVDNKSDMIDILIKAGGKPNGPDGQCPALLTAALMSATEATRSLLDGGANPDSENDTQNTALHQAIYEAPLELIQMLLDAGAKTDTFDHINQSPLVYAISQQRPDVVKAILEAGADPNFEDVNGQIALDQAVSSSYDYTPDLEKCIDLLLEHGADVSSKYFGSTAFESALTYDYKKSARRISKFSTVKQLKRVAKELGVDTESDEAIEALAPNVDAYTLRLWIYQDRKLAKRLIEAGAGKENEDGYSPLGLAISEAEKEDDSIVASLIENGFDPNASAMYGQRALELAAEKQFTRVIETLLEKGADPNANDSRALYNAASKGDVEVMGILIAAGANANPVEAGWTPLMAAAKANHADAVQILLDAGADPAVKNRKGETALDQATQAEAADVVSLLGAL